MIRTGPALTTSSTLDFILKTNGVVRVSKEHCKLYDIVIGWYMNKIIKRRTENYEEKYQYYTDLFSDRFNQEIKMDDAYHIDSFFEKNKITNAGRFFESLTNENGNLLIIPTFFGYEPTENKDLIVDFLESPNIKNKDAYEDLKLILNQVSEGDPPLSVTQSTPQKPTIGTQKNNNILYTPAYAYPQSPNSNKNSVGKKKNTFVYFLPCLIPKEDSKSIEQDEYSKMLDEELSKLQKYLQDDFNRKIQEQISHADQNQILKNIQIFCDPDGSISLNYYKNITKKSKQWLNEQLFKKLANLDSKLDEGKQKIIVAEQIDYPKIFKYTNSKIQETFPVVENQFITFLIQQTLEDKIFNEKENEQKMKFEKVDKMNILYTIKMKRDKNKFDFNILEEYKITFKQFKESYIIFKFDIAEKNKLKQSENKIPNMFFKITPSEYKIDDIEKKKEYKRNERRLYLKIKKGKYLNHVALYIKSRQNIHYEIKDRGIIQLNDSDKKLQLFNITHLTRQIEPNINIYYYKNFLFDLNSFRNYVKEMVLNGNDHDKISVRGHFLKTFTDKALLNDYYVYCYGNDKYNQNIMLDSVTDEYNKKVIDSILNELFRKGEKMYTNEKKDIMMNNVEVTPRTYNKYKIKNVKDKNIYLKNNTNRIKSIIDANKRKNKPKIEKHIDRSKAIDIVQLELYLENEITKTDNLNSTSGKLPRKKCSMRKKKISTNTQSLFSDLMKNVTFKLRSFT